jgi:transcriptional regulator with XRE-family HTH domain
MAVTSLAYADNSAALIDRSWGRELLERAGKTQLDLSRAWGLSTSATSRWLDGQTERGLTLAQAAAFCRTTGITLDELAAHLGIHAPGVSTGEPGPIMGPPIPTVKITQAPRGRRWRLLLHLDLPAEALTGITAALDEAAALERRGKI